MTAVLVAVFSALGGVMAGLVPTLAVSERRRLLKFIRDEAATLKEVEGDDDAQAHVRQALHASTSRYRSLAVQTRWSKAVRQFELIRGPAALALGLGLSVSVASRFVSDDTWSVALIAVGAPLGLLGGGLLLGMAFRVAAASREEGAIQVALDAERERRAAAEASIDELAATLSDFGSAGLQGAEVEDLLAALQRSVDAAKESRSVWTDTYGMDLAREHLVDADHLDIVPRFLADQEAEAFRRRSEEVHPDPDEDGLR